MALDADHPDLRDLRARLAPYARTLLDRAGAHALRLHADVVSIEHLLAVLMHDAECAAHQLVLHAFADPETIASETLAISPGVMVVAADSTLPFSAGGLRALHRARELAIERGAGEVAIEALLAAALDELDEEALGALRAAGLAPEAREPARATAAAASDMGDAGAPAIDVAEPLFRHFSMGAKRALSSANRASAQADQDSISAAQIAIGCLRTEEPLAERAGLSWQRARLLLAGHTLDDEPPRLRRLPPDRGLVEFLGGVPTGADSLGLLAALRTAGPPELAELLTRHKIGTELLERARGAFEDPDPAP